MALLKWDDEEDKKVNDSIFGVPQIKTVNSVQNGAWQPTDATTAQPQNYMVSNEKAKVDADRRQRQAEEEATRLAAAEQAESARRAMAAQSVATQSIPEAQTPIDAAAAKEDTGWKKYYDDSFKQEKKLMNSGNFWDNFWGNAMDNGQASRRAEVSARNKYTNELLTRAYDDSGNTLDQGTADKARSLSAYNMASANNNGQQTEAISNSIGATKNNQDDSFWGKVKSTANAIKNMSIYDALIGADDSTRFGVNDVGRFVGGMVQNVVTSPIIGAKELTEAGTGRGTDTQTGLEDNLTAAERVGRGISGGLNVVSPFFGGSGKLLESLAAKTARGVATAAEKTIFKQLIAKILYPAIEQGGIGATQAGAEYFGNGNTLVDEKGDIDINKLFEFAKQTGTAGALGFGGGAIMAGAGVGINKLRNKKQPVLSARELADIETRTTNAGEAQLADVRQVVDGSQVDLKRLEDGSIVLPGFDKSQLAPTASLSDIATTYKPAKPIRVSRPITPLITPEVAGANPSLGSLLKQSGLSRSPKPLDSINSAKGIEASKAKPAAIETPIVPKRLAKTDNIPPVVADGTLQPSKVVPAVDTKTPVIKSEEVRKLKEAKAGASQAEEAVINQKIKEVDSATPAINENVPEGMGADGAVDTETGVPLTRKQVAERLMPKLADNSDVKQRIATAVGMGKDTASPIRDILREGDIKPEQAERVASQFDTLEKHLKEYNRLEEMNQKAYADGGTESLSPEVSRDRSRVARDMGTTTRRLVTEINRMEGSRSYKTRLINGITDLIGVRNASVLSSAGLIERNIMQELTANTKLFAKNPIKMVKSTFNNGNILRDTAKAELSHWRDAPRNPIEAVKYVVGNTYRTAMIPTTALANTRRGAVRDELTRWAFTELEGRNIGSGEAHKLAGTAGNEMEALVNTFIGVDNGMTSRKQATDALKAWKEYIRTGDDGAKSAFLKKVETHSSLADQMITGLSKDDATKARGLMAIKNLIFPFVRTATNLMKTAVKQDLNPFAKSLLDEIRVDQRGGTANAVNLIKSKLVDYGIMGGAAALATSGVIVYSNGEDVDKPRGWSVKVSDTSYIPVRATSLELPIAMAGTAQAMASDISQGKTQDWKHYAEMVTGSLPYIDQFNTTTGAVDSLMSGEDAGYAAKSYGVNMAKSFVPFSNNGIQPYVEGKQGKSTNAKTVYDDNMFTWLKNTVRKAYDPDFYNSLKDSRDNAGRVRTVDNQGVISNKTMNDPNTAKYNKVITDMVNYSRENKLGEGVKDIFNTYDTGKNNNFKSVQDAITFLDAPEVDGKATPDNAKKLEKNDKIADLAQQIRNGFYGDTGSELLTLDGQPLKSDVSVPNSTGSKNSKLPLSMQSIKNAIAQTDLGTEANDKLFEISGQKTDLYNQLKAKTINYTQYSAAKSELEKGEIDILSGSKNYLRLVSLMDNLDKSGFFAADGIGSTKSGQTYLWNSLNALLGSKGATPAANYPDASKSYTPWGNGNGINSTNKPGDRKNTGIKWSPVTARKAAATKSGKYTPLNISVKLGNQIRKDKSQNYTARNF